MENKPKSGKFALISRQIELTTHISTDVLRSEADQKFKPLAKLSAEPGTLVKIFQTDTDNGKIIVQVLDFVRHDFIYENLYQCLQNDLIKVPDDLWPYVISIAQPDRRLRLVNNKDQCRWLVHLKQNDLLSVKGELFKKKGCLFDCIVRYIGPVQELHPVGYFFGLELLDLENGRSPQSESIPFAIKYMHCDPSLSIFATAEWLTPISSEVKKKFSAGQLINDTIGRVYTAIAPGTLNINSQRKDKNAMANKPTAQFYDTPLSLSKDQLGDSAQALSVSFQNEDIKNNDKEIHSNHKDTNKAADNYATIERKQLNAHPVDADFAPNRTGMKKNGILKHGKNSSFNSIKDANISSGGLAKSNENRATAVENAPHEDVDLADLLGTNWPTSAGEAAKILNRSQNSSESNEDKLSKFMSTPRTSTSPEREHKLIDKTPAPAPANDSHIKPADIQQFSEVPGSQLTIGSLVEISDSEIPGELFGVIRWIGIPPGAPSILVGIELEDDGNLKGITSDGSYNGIRLFQCPEGRAIFVEPNKVAMDHRFIDVDCNSSGKAANDPNAEMFGHVDCPPVSGSVAPLRAYNYEELEDICGKFKGIQGHHNSCYLDATLFSMFTFTSVFDSLLYRLPIETQDIPHYSEVQKVLRDEIVNPLRKNVFVRADRVMKLRKLLDQLSSVSGLTSEEKDPEEFLNSMLAQILRVEPFLKLSSGQDSYFYQLFVEKDERLTFPTVQQLFEQSFHSSDIKLKEVPSCLIIQMPRFGKNFKMYPRILPSQVLDVTDIIEDSPRQCSVCGILAEYECRECFGDLQGGSGLEYTAFCQKCLNTVHMHAKRTNHVSRKLSIPKDFKIMAEHMVVPRLYMELFAVVCIETSHYVTFVKAGSGPDAPWCFFDSMADRKGERNGYNIPEMISVPDLPKWLSDEGARLLNETSTNDKVLPEHAKRLFCDAYMCMYQSTDVMMYH